jgi:hypothetical protein
MRGLGRLGAPQPTALRIAGALAVFFCGRRREKFSTGCAAFLKTVFSSFLKRVAFAGSLASRGFQRMIFGLLWQIPG